MNVPAILRRSGLLLAALIALPAAAWDVVTPPLAPDSGDIAVRCGTLIDGVAAAPEQDVLVVVRDGRIRSVTAAARARTDLPVLDLSAHTCLPGLIDTHTHITESTDDSTDYTVYFRRGGEEQERMSAEYAAVTLNAGFTTVRNVGAYIAFTAMELRGRIDRGDLPGPRIQPAGFYLTIPGGGGDLLLPGVAEADIPLRVRMGVARGPEQFAEKARLAVEHGAGVLKVIASGAVLAFGGVPGAPEMTPEEIRAVVEVGHAAGLTVTAHAHGAQSIKDAIRAGVDCIEHASLADEEAIRMAAEREVCFSMDVYNGDWIATVGREQGWPEEFIRKNDETTEAQRQAFSRAWRAGVPIVYGTDAGVYAHGLNARQFRIMVERGMPPLDAIKSATSVAALHMGWGDRVGRIAPGWFGDIIAVRGDPLADITRLEQVEVVIKGGLPFRLPAESGMAAENSR